MNRKLILSILFIALVGTASAAIISEYFIHDTHATIEEAISINKDVDILTMYGGESQSSTFMLTNNANVAIEGEIKTTYSPDGQGLSCFYSYNGATLTDEDGNGRVEITVPPKSTIQVIMTISAMPNIAGGEYTIASEMKAI